MKQRKRVIKIVSIDEVAGRIIADASGLAEGASVCVFLNGELWGTAKVSNQQAFVVGNHALPATYSLLLTTKPVNSKPLPTQ